MPQQTFMPLDGAKRKHALPTGVNLAPVEPLRHLKSDKRPWEHSTLAQIIRELHQSVREENMIARREIAETGRLMSNLRASKDLFPVRDPIHGGFALLKPLPSRANGTKVYPLAQVNSSQLTSIWTASRPRATVRHFGNTNKAQIQQALVETVINHYDLEIFDVYFNQRESLSMMDFGCTVIKPYYDSKLNTIHHLKPIIENTSKSLFPSYGWCADCGHEGEAEEFREEGVKGDMGYCPECGSSNVPALSEAFEVETAEITGAQRIEQGDLGAELLAVPACNWDMRVLVQDSPYFQYYSEVSVRLVESLLGIEVVREDPENNFGIDIINAIGNRGGSVEGYGRDRLYGHDLVLNDRTLMIESHFKPEMYAGMRLSKPEKTVSGETIPANVPLEEVFTDGIFAVGFQDYDVCALVSPEKRREVSSVYHIQSFSGVGKGTSDSIETSQHLNMAHTAALETIKRFGAGGGYAYDKDVLSDKQAKALLKPGGMVGLSLAGTNYSNVNQALWQVQNKEVNQSNLLMVAQLANLLNICFQTTSFTDGVSDGRVKINTKGGQELLAAQNQQRSIAPLAMKGWSRARIFEQLIDLFREHIQVPKFFTTGDKFALTKGRFISGEDLPEMIRCDFVTDSEIPSNEYFKRDAVERMAESSSRLGVSYAQLIDLSPRLAAWWAHKFGVEDLPLFNQQEILMVCQERLDNLKEIVGQADMIAQLAGYYPPVEEIAPQLIDQLRRKLFLSEQNHSIKAEVLSEYLDDDETQQWSPLMSAAVEALIQRHYELDGARQLRTQAIAQQGQLALQQQAQAAMAPMQQQAQQEAQQQAVQAAMLEKAAGLVEQEEAFSREQEGADLDHARALELAQIQKQGSR